MHITRKIVMSITAIKNSLFINSKSTTPYQLAISGNLKKTTKKPKDVPLFKLIKTNNKGSNRKK